MSAGLDLFAPGSAAALVLVGTRVSGLVLVAPVFSAKTVPVVVRTGIVILLTALLQPAALARVGAAPAITAPALAGEAVVGFALGLGAALFVAAAEAAGELMASSSGLTGASLFDPLNNSSAPALAQFAQLFAVAVLLAADAHLAMLDALAASMRAVPVGGVADLPAGIAAAVRSAGMLFVLGLQFAGPVIAAVLIANTALAVLSRAAPALNIMSVAFPIQIGIGLLAVSATLPLIAHALTNWEPGYDQLLTRVLGAAAGGAR